MRAQRIQEGLARRTRTNHCKCNTASSQLQSKFNSVQQ